MEILMKNTKKNERLDALAKITTSADKVIWRKVGAAFPLKNRPGFSLRLEFMPVPSEGSFEFILVEPNASPKASRE
jgi:hypothetical protein